MSTEQGLARSNMVGGSQNGGQSRMITSQNGLVSPQDQRSQNGTQNGTHDQTESQGEENPLIPGDENKSSRHMTIGVTVASLLIGVILFIVFFTNYLTNMAGGSNFDYILTSSDKPLVDKRDYGFKIFPNQLRYLAIQDKESEKAAVAVLVNVGSLRNPKEVPGLAHLLEHTVFIGSKNFPEKTGFDDFKNKYMGSSNAFTAEDRTVYYLGIMDGGLAEGIERTGDFMLNPSLISGSEVNAVEAEHEKNIQTPGWRLHATIDWVFDPKGLGRFGTGSKKTLGLPTITNELQDFHSKFYYPASMCLVTISPQSIEDQFAMIKKSEFWNGKNPENPWKDPRPYVVDPQYGRYIHMYNEQSPTPKLYIQFPMQVNLEPHYRAGFSAYFDRVFNYEGIKEKQGLQSQLLDMELIFGCGVDLSWTEYLAVLSFSASLRQPEYVEQVMNEFWKYLKLVKQRVNMEIYSSIEDTSAFLWQWTRNDGSRSDLAVGYAEALMSKHPPEELLVSGKIKSEPEFLREMLSWIVPERMTVIFTEKNGTPEEPKEKWELQATPEYNAEFVEGLWDIDKIKKGILKNDNDFFGYSFPKGLEPPPKITKKPSDYLIKSTPEYPYGPSPKLMDGGMYYRWGSVTSEPTFKFLLRLFVEIEMSYLTTPHYFDAIAFIKMWSRMLGHKMSPILEDSETCGTSLGLDTGYQNLFGLTISVRGYYSEACDHILTKVLDILMGLKSKEGSAQATMREQVRGQNLPQNSKEKPDYKGLVARTTEALYLDMTDVTSSQPYAFATGALGTVLQEDGIPSEGVAAVVKTVRDQRFSEIGKTPLPDANKRIKVDEYMPNEATPLPDSMPHPPPKINDDKKRNDLKNQVPPFSSVREMDSFIVDILKGILVIDGKNDDENTKVKTIVKKPLKMYADGMVFGGIEESEAKKLRDLITTKLNAIRDPSNPITWEPKPLGQGRRILKTGVELEQHNKRFGDTNDVTFIRYTKPAKYAEYAPKLVVSSTSIPPRIFVSMKEIIVHGILDTLFQAFTFSRLRTLALEKAGKQRYIVSGSIGGGRTNTFSVDVLLQTNKENLDEVHREVNDHIFKNFGPYLLDTGIKEFETSRASELKLLEAPPDDSGSEFGHFLGALDEPRATDYEGVTSSVPSSNQQVNKVVISDCIFQGQIMKKQVLKSIKPEDLIEAWEGFVGTIISTNGGGSSMLENGGKKMSEKIQEASSFSEERLPPGVTKRTSMVYADQNRAIDMKKSVAAYMKAKQNPANLDYHPLYGGTVECMRKNGVPVVEGPK